MYKSNWKTLETEGPLFPEPYQPRGWRLAGESLSPTAESMLYAAAPHFSPVPSQYAQKPVFVQNFYSCLKPELTAAQSSLSFPNSPEFTQLFSVMVADRNERKESLKAYRAANKESVKAETEARKAKYGFAVLDGKREPIGSYLIESAGILMARGESAELGLWKWQAEPEDLVINCSSNPPAPPAGRHWKEIVCNHGFAGPYTYKVKLGPRNAPRRWITKDVRFSYSSSVGASADSTKYKDALELHRNWDPIYEKITRNAVTNANPAVVEACKVIWLIANTAVRIGGSSSELRENGVVGASSLEPGNISIRFPTLTEAELSLSFIGKDSIPFNQSYSFSQSESAADFKVVQSLAELVNARKGCSRLFSVDTSFINLVCKKLLPSLSAKLFRPAKGSHLLAVELAKEPIDSLTDRTPAQLVEYFRKSQVACSRLLNHKRTVTAKAKESLESRKAKLSERESVTLAKIADLESQLAQLDFSSTDIEFESSVQSDKAVKLEARIAKLKESLDSSQSALAFKESTMDDNLSTALTAYLDPGLVVSWCSAVGLDPRKLYTKGLQTRFGWIFESYDSDTIDPTYWESWL